MRAVKESKRLVALLAVLFLMSGVFSVIAAASPEDADLSDPVQAYSPESKDLSEAMSIQAPKIKKVLFEKHRSEMISAKAETANQAVLINVSSEAAVPDQAELPVTEEYVYQEPDTDVPDGYVSESAYEDVQDPEAVSEGYSEEEEYISEEYAAEPEYIAEEYTEEPENVPEEYAEEPEYIPEEPAAEPEYIPEEPAAEPEYIPEEPAAEPEYIPEEPAAEPEYIPEEPAPSPEAEPSQPVTGEEQEALAESEPEEESGPALTYLGNFMLTAYCPCSACCGAYATGYTASGTKATEGVTIAMGGLDFGTKVSINGHIYTVEDRGTAYGHVDIFFADHASALAFGLKYADVYLVD